MRTKQWESEDKTWEVRSETRTGEDGWGLQPGYSTEVSRNHLGGGGGFSSRDVTVRGRWRANGAGWCNE